jgi:hypothetical protein
MKKLLTLSLIAALTLSVFAQAPQRLSYQAVIRNSTGGLVTSHAVGMKISILQGSATGTAVYVETHTSTTNANGLATIEIGGGSVVSGTFATINWASGTYFLKTETDPAGGSSYTIVGTSQLLSVPYALNSKISESIADNSVTSTKIAGGSVTGTKIAQAGATSGQVLKWNGTTWLPAVDAIVLPYSGTGTSGSPLFDITNLGTSGAISTFSSGNYGIWGESGSSSGIGVYGVNKTSTGTTYGVFGDVYSPTGFSGFFQGGKFYIKGNTGIGTQDPSAKLEVSGQVKITGGSPGAGKVLTSDGDGLATWQTPEVNLWLKNSNNIYYNAGKVGIGTTVPGTLLHVHSNITYVNNVTPIIRISDNFKTWNIGLGDPGDRFSISSEDNKDRLTILKSNGFVGFGTTAPSAGLHIKANTWPGSFIYIEANAGSDAGLRLYEGTTPKWHIYNNAAAGGLLITNNLAGTAFFVKQSPLNVGIGTTNPAYTLDVAGDVNLIKGLSGAALFCNGAQAIWYNGTYFSWGYEGQWNYLANKVYIGSAATDPGTNMLVVNGTAAKPGGGSWATWSDSRLKDIHGNYLKGLKQIVSLRPVSISYRKDNSLKLPDDQEYAGLVAQDVQNIFPEAVSEGTDGYLQLDNNSINIALINAIRELKAENDRLKSENENISLRLEKLEAKIGK